MVMATDMEVVMAITADIMPIAMAPRRDGIMDARSAGVVTGARPACGSKAVTDALYPPMMQGVA